MKKKYFLFLALLAFAISCDEAGVESDISKISELSFDIVTGDFTNLGGFLVADLSSTIDPASEDFDEYLNDVENYFINRVEVQITEYAAGDAPTLVFFGMGAGPVATLLGPNILSEDSRTSNNTPLIDALTDSNDKIGNTDRIVIFDRKTPSNGLVQSSNPGLQEIITALENSTPFQGKVQVAVQGGTLSDFTVTIFFDLTARVKLD